MAACRREAGLAACWVCDALGKGVGLDWRQALKCRLRGTYTWGQLKLMNSRGNLVLKTALDPVAESLILAPEPCGRKWLHKFKTLCSTIEAPHGDF